MNDSSHSEYAFVLVVFTLENEENAYTFNIIEHHYQRTCKGRFFSLFYAGNVKEWSVIFFYCPNKLYVQSTWLPLSRESEKVCERAFGKMKTTKTLSNIIFHHHYFVCFRFALTRIFSIPCYSQKKEWRRKKKFNLCEEGKILLSKWII